MVPVSVSEHDLALLAFLAIMRFFFSGALYHSFISVTR